MFLGYFDTSVHSMHFPFYILLMALLPSPYTTRASSSMPDHAVAMPHAKTSTLDRTFHHSVIRIWNALPDTVVGKIKSDSVQSFKQRVNKYMLLDIIPVFQGLASSHMYYLV